MSDLDEPSHHSYQVTGLIGIIIYSSILGINIFAYVRRAKYSLLFSVFFGSICAVCLFELPRYILMYSNGKYASKVGYSFHILASYFFFFSLTLIARMWSTVADLGRFESKIYNKYSLFIFNGIFLVICVLSIGSLIHEPNLNDFFVHRIFTVLTITELTCHVIYTTCLSYLSVKLIIRFHRYARNSSRPNSLNKKTQNELSDGFNEVLHKVFFSFTVLLLCSLIRVFMFLVKLNIVKNHLFVEYETFWFILTDFIPRGVACLTVIYLMFYKPIKQSFLNEKKNRPSEHGTQATQRESNVSNLSARYRDEDELEVDEFRDIEKDEFRDIDNPIRPKSFAMKRGSGKPGDDKNMNPVLMTEFFRESEDFDRELEMAMDNFSKK